jgi:hypothetical protein
MTERPGPDPSAPQDPYERDGAPSPGGFSFPPYSAPGTPQAPQPPQFSVPDSGQDADSPYGRPAAPQPPGADPFADPQAHQSGPASYDPTTGGPAPGYPGYPGYPGAAPTPGYGAGYPTSGPPGFGPPGYGAPSSGPGYGAPMASGPYGAPPPGDPLGLPQRPRNDPMAIAAMGVGIGAAVLALFGCCCTPVGVLGTVAGIVAAVIGFLSRKRVLESGGTVGGAQQALVGMITGGVAVALGVLALVLGIVVFAGDFS